VHHRSGAGKLAAYRQTLQLVPTGVAPASLIPVVAVVFICGLSDVLINEYFFIIYLFIYRPQKRKRHVLQLLILD